MTKQETVSVMAILRAGLPNAYLNLSSADALAMANLWSEMFANSHADLVMAAAKTYIWNDKSGRFPTPGAIRDYMADISRIIDHCAYGCTLIEYVGETAAEKYPPPVREYMDRAYRQRHMALYGRPFTSQQEKLAAHVAMLTDGGETE